MSIMNLDRVHDKDSVDFINKIGAQMSNIIYESDPVPRGYAHLDFIGEVIENALPQVVKGIPVPGIFRRLLGVQSRIQGALNEQIEANAATLMIAEGYRHIGKVIYYENDAATPVSYIDKGFHYVKPKECTQKLFYDIEYVKSKDVFTTAKTNHMFLVAGPGLAYGIKKTDKTEAKK